MEEKQMPQPEKVPLSKTYRGTVDEVFSHRHEIPAGATVELKVFPKQTKPHHETATMTLLRSWLEEDATDDSDEITQAQEDLNEFKRNLNQPRKDAGARLLYPEVRYRQLKQAACP